MAGTSELAVTVAATIPMEPPERSAQTSAQITETKQTVRKTVPAGRASRVPRGREQHRGGSRAGDRQSRHESGDEPMIKHRVAPPRVTAETVLLTFKEAMDFLRVSRSTLYRLMWSGQLRGHKVGSTWRFYESDLLDAVASPTMSASVTEPVPSSEGRE